MKIIEIFVPGSLPLAIIEANKRNLAMPLISVVPGAGYSADESGCATLYQGHYLVARVTDMQRKAMTDEERRAMIFEEHNNGLDG